jgi:hypothetical protein
MDVVIGYLENFNRQELQVIIVVVLLAIVFCIIAHLTLFKTIGIQQKIHLDFIQTSGVQHCCSEIDSEFSQTICNANVVVGRHASSK